MSYNVTLQGSQNPGREGRTVELAIPPNHSCCRTCPAMVINSWFWDSFASNCICSSRTWVWSFCKTCTAKPWWAEIKLISLQNLWPYLLFEAHHFRTFGVLFRPGPISHIWLWSICDLYRAPISFPAESQRARLKKIVSWVAQANAIPILMKFVAKIAKTLDLDDCRWISSSGSRGAWPS